MNTNVRKVCKACFEKKRIEFQKILEIVESGAIGTPRDIEAAFTKIGSAAGREMWSEYGGSFVELGSYVLLPVVKLYGTEEKPQITRMA